MSEMTPYFDAITSARAMLLDEDEALAGATTISLETQADLAEDDILTYVQTNFAGFLKMIRFLSKEDQEMLLSYYILSKTQNTLALIHKSTQTVCSFRIRMAVKKLGTFMLLGEPSVEAMSKILVKSGLESSLEKIGLSEVVDLYKKTRSFAKVAEVYGLHRPDIRRAMSRAAKQLNDSKSGHEVALGAYIHGLIDKASAAGQGFSKRKLAKQCHIFHQDPQILGEFRIDVKAPGFEHLFTSRANR